MLSKIKNAAAAAGVMAIALAVAYFKGLKQGRENEKIENLERVQKNARTAAKARAGLGDPDTLRRLRNKYGRR